MRQTPAENGPGERLVMHNLVRADLAAGFGEDVRAGLSSHPKRLFPKYFYDALGSQLFEAICMLPEYYLTRAENEILTRHSDDIVSDVGGGEVSLVEMGSGSAFKTRLIIEALLRRRPELLFVPVDISQSALETSSRVLLQSYPGLSIRAYASDYYDGLKALSEERPPGRILALFLGSNIGNFDPGEAHTFLRAMRAVLGPGDALLLGADLKKKAAVLEAAYDDSLGVTAAFNLNLLARINRKLGADFDLRAFGHKAVYNEGAGRVEMYLVSRREQTVHVRRLGMEVRFAEGERIHTENSYKYDTETLSRMARAAGFRLTRTWLDVRGQFSSNLLISNQ